MHHRAMGRFLQWLVRPTAVQARRPVSLWGVKVWAELMRSWQEPHCQHDAAEFMQHIAPLLVPSPNMSHWQARRLSSASPAMPTPAEAQVIDQGTLWPMMVSASLEAPVLLSDLQSGAPPAVSLQNLLIKWRNQASRHALVTTPEWMVLQVGRFDDSGRKVQTPVSISTAVYIPYFPDNSLTTASIRYRVVAIVYHIGPAMLTGHYRTALCQDGQIKHVTDDGQEAATATSSEVHLIQANAYLFFVRKC